MSTIIRSPVEPEVPAMMKMVNRHVAANIMLPRDETRVRQSLTDWLVAVEDDAAGEVVGCGSLVPLTEDLVEIRSLVVDESQQGRGLGGELVRALVKLAREHGFSQVCALTLREGFFVRLGFELVDRWSISPKVWQACIYCPKFHRCDEVAVLMNLVEEPVKVAQRTQRSPAVNALMRWSEWQPLRLAYKQGSRGDKASG
jgi:amino-acid N-acetyltransferase